MVPCKLTLLKYLVATRIMGDIIFYTFLTFCGFAIFLYYYSYYWKNYFHENSKQVNYLKCQFQSIGNFYSSAILRATKYILESVGENGAITLCLPWERMEQVLCTCKHSATVT